MDRVGTIEDVVSWFEVAGVLILIVGSFYVAVTVAIALVHGEADYERVRRQLGRTLLLGLEVLVAADVIQTVAIDPTLESAATLGLLVLVRTILSISIDMEIDGIAPWRKAEFAASSAAPKSTDAETHAPADIQPTDRA